MRYRPGERVQLIYNSDVGAPLRPGDTGTVTGHDTGDLVHVAWDNGSHQPVHPDTDQLRRLPTTAHLLGEGQLSWPAVERHTDRYGTVVLIRDRERERDRGPGTYVPLPRDIHGMRGTLYAEVLATRPSNHIGDLDRGLTPQTPTVGERIHLGTGTARVHTSGYGADMVTLAPDDGRAQDWLDPQGLYRVLHQTVRLLFTPFPHSLP